jgi:hypothetical protein
MLVASLLAAPRGWAEAVQWATEWEEQWQQQRPCPVLIGPAEVGDPRDGMAEAGRLAKGVDRRENLAQLAAKPALDGELSEEDRSLLLAMQPAVDALRKAARLQVVSRTRLSERSDLFGMSDLVSACDALVATAHAQGATDPGAASDQLLDGVRVATELMHGATVFETVLGALLLERCLIAFGDAMIAGMDAPRLQRLEKALGEVDACLPEDQALAQRYACEMVSVVSGSTLNGYAMPTVSLRAWRQGFSVSSWYRALATSVVEIVRQPATRGADGESNWSERRRQLDQITSEVVAAGRDYSGVGAVNFAEREENARRAVTQLRLLRLAVAFHLGREFPTLRDPLGNGDLVVRIDGKAATFSSAQARLPARTAQRR